MKVVKRSGKLEDVKFDQITDRLRMLSGSLSIDPIKIARTVCAQIKDFITTRELDELSATICASLSIQEPEYDILGTRILISSHEKDTKGNFVDVVSQLQSNLDVLNEPSPILDHDFASFVLENRDIVSKHFSECIEKYPLYQMSMFGWKTLYRSYLLQSNRKVVERPEHLFYRVALYLHYPNLEKTEETYRHLVSANFIHATPTLFHAGTKRPQLSSCFLLGTEDNVDGIYKTITDVARISKWAGGIGVHISNIRGKNSYIRGTNGYSNGIMPMLRVYNDTSRYIDQCVHPDTFVFTRDGMKPIYKLESSDFILQKDGNYELLKRKLEHSYNGDLFLIEMENGVSFEITPEHPVFGRHSPFEKNCWIDVQDVRVGDELSLPIPTFTIDNPDYTNEMLFCWGLMLGWGSFSLETVLQTIEIPHNSPMKEQLEEFFTLNLIHYSIDDSNRLTFSFNSNCPFTFHHFITNKTQKHIHPSLLHLPRMKLVMFLKGFLYSHSLEFQKDIIVLHHHHYDYHLFSYLCLRLQIATRFISPSSIGISRVDVEQQELLTNKIPKLSLIQNENVHHKITNITKRNYSGVLYDLEFEKEHSYVIPSATLHNGGGKRKGSFAIYIEPWHCDIFDFVYAKRNVGNEDERARDLFYGLWIPDLFMKRVEEDGIWSLMCPNVSVGLEKVYGDEFDSLYTKYEMEGKFVKQIQARELWKEILQSQIETGLPYMLYKDSCNKKSNQQNIGTIRSSNLCCEIIEVSNTQEYAVCNLASINLSNCIKENQHLSTLRQTKLTIYTKETCVYCILLKARLERLGITYEDISLTKYPQLSIEQNITTVPRVIYQGKFYGYTDFWNEFLCPEFDFEELSHRVSILVVNMNQIIDKNFYPTKETKTSNMNHRPIGIGVQGLADLFCILGTPFDSVKARLLNRKIFETMYYSAITTSMNYATTNDKIYSTFNGSPLSNGKFHFELCDNFDGTLHYDWETLRKNVMKFGVANSLFLAPMPTASTSQILNQNECFEPFTSNLYVRRTLAGEFTIFNKYLVQDLRDLGLWNQETIDNLIVHRGSIQQFSKLPSSIRQIYKTAWEIPQKSLIDMAYQRQWFIDQSQSFNIFVAEPSLEKLTKIHFYGWKNGLKTGSYYIRTKPQHFSQNFTIDPTKENDCKECSA